MIERKEWLHFKENALSTLDQKASNRLKQDLEEQSNKFIQDNSNFIAEALEKLDINQANTHYYVEFSLLISSLLKGEEEYFSIEIFDDDWYSNCIFSARTTCDIFFSTWTEMDTAARLEAKKYMGKISVTDVDREMIAWLLRNAHTLFPYLEKSIAHLHISDHFKPFFEKDTTFYFGLYRFMNEPFAIQKED